MNDTNLFLVASGILSLSVALLHIAIIIGGANWYRLFGAGETMARMAEKGSWIPAFITSGIVVVFIVWGFYAFAGVGYISRLPFLKQALAAISCIYLFRGLVLIPRLLFIPHKVDRFAVLSSLASLVIGICYAIGTSQEWGSL